MFFNWKLAAAAAIIIAALGGIVYVQASALSTIRAERDGLRRQLTEATERAKQADAETQRLTRKIAALRKAALRKAAQREEDKLNETIRQAAQRDDCLQRSLDPAILDRLRGSGK